MKNKFLIALSSLIISLGLILFWFGMNSQSDGILPQPKLLESPSVPVTKAPEIIEIEGERKRVIKVVDGDTIIIDGDLTVRLIGIDTPETVDPRRPVECFGKQASNEMKKLLTDQVVVLQKDVSETDKYKRLLRYVFLPLEGGKVLFVNDYMLREGFAKALTYPPDVKYTEQFLEAEKNAKNFKKGLWKACN